MGKWLLLALVGCSGSSATIGAGALGDAGADVARPVDASHDVATGNDAGEDAAPELDATDDGAIVDAGVDTAPPPECTVEGAQVCIAMGHGIGQCIGGQWESVTACANNSHCACNGSACQCQF